ncbi:NAD-dependent deacylase [Roseivivax sp. CAU 1761]
MAGDKIVILSGAGLSAESGLGTFRDRDGIWSRVRIEDVATPEAFARDPARVHAFYNARRVQAAKASPNPAHHALARLQRALGDRAVLVTQNVDGLLAAAGARALHMHGRLAGALCAACGHRWEAPPEMHPDDACPSCQAAATRPDVVWFGEMPHHLDEIDAHLAEAGLFAAIGTSGQVYPAAGFVEIAAAAGAGTVEINLADTETSPAFAERLTGPASAVVPDWVDRLLAQ